MAGRELVFVVHSLRVKVLELLIVLSISFKIQCASISNGQLAKGFSASEMAFVDTDGTFLASTNGTFSFGFSNPPNDRINYYLCVIHAASQTIVWTANRDSPVSSSDLFVFAQDGNAALASGNGTNVVWSTNTAGRRVQTMELHDSGNLVLLDDANNTVWESFDFPTDTLLSGQQLKPGMKLVSGTSRENTSSCLYFLTMSSGNLLLFLAYNPPQAYWSMTQDARISRLSSEETPSYARLDRNGLSLVGSDSTVVYQLPLKNLSPSTTLTMAVLENDGSFYVRIYTDGIWSQQFAAVEGFCSLPLYCGSYGICAAGQCSCPQNLKPLNNTNIAQGCQEPSGFSCENSSNSASAEFLEVGTGLDYFANYFSAHLQTPTVDACQQLCAKNCSCLSFFFYNDSSDCFLWPHLATIQQTGNRNHFAFVKTGNLTQFTIETPVKGPPQFVLPVIIGGTTFLIILMICTFAFWLFHVRKKVSLPEETVDDDFFLETISGLPTRFSYKDLQIATNSFSKKLGSGGFGSVYEGVLSDQTRVAVKQLEGVGQGKKEFRAEVAIIGSIHHVHLVQLRGFCFEGTHRLLVYEFMANGSLDKCLFVEDEETRVLDWTTRYNIALGTARGLAYLHDDCREKIIHCDIKPENILLDERYIAKVSDFGLAKLLNKEQSQVFTSLRGTRGYLAPEWLMNLAISEKSDVYSFGLVLLEIISGRKNFDFVESSEKWYFPAYAFQQAKYGNLEELVDIKIREFAVADQVVKAVHVALWCIQEEAHVRPSMAKVVQMLEGNIITPQPPTTSQLAVRLHAQMVQALRIDEQLSSASDYNSEDILSATQLSAPR